VLADKGADMIRDWQRVPPLPRSKSAAADFDHSIWAAETR